MKKFFYAMCKADYHGFKKDKIYYCESRQCDDMADDIKTVIVIKEHRYEFLYVVFCDCFYTEKEYRMLKLKKINKV